MYIRLLRKRKRKKINDSVYYESDEHAGTIGDSSKQVGTSNKPITDTHIVKGINNLSVRIVSIEKAVIGVGISGQGITQGVIIGRTNIGSNIVTDILTNYSKQLFETNTFQVNLLQSETLVIGPQDESVKITNRIISKPSDSRNIHRNRISRIYTPGVNKDIWSVIDTTLNGLSCTDKVDKFDTLIHGSMTQERNLESSRIKEVDVKSIFPELGTELDSRVRVNLTNSVLGGSPKFIRFGHPTVETAETRNINFDTSTIVKRLNRLLRGTERDDRLGKTHGFETMSETTAYRNHIKNSVIETREVLERETSSTENIQRTLPMNIVT